MKTEKNMNTEVDEKPVPILFAGKESEKVSVVNVCAVGQFS